MEPETLVDALYLALRHQPSQQILTHSFWHQYQVKQERHCQKGTHAQHGHDHHNQGPVTVASQAISPAVKHGCEPAPATGPVCPGGWSRSPCPWGPR